MFPAINGLRFSTPPPATKPALTPKASEVNDPSDGFTPSQGEPPATSATSSFMQVTSKSLVIGAGLTLMGVPAPISATIAVGHLVSQAAPETTGKLLSNSATVMAVASAGVIALGGALAAPIAELGGQFVRHGVGHNFLPGFSD